MQEAIPFRTRIPSTAIAGGNRQLSPTGSASSNGRNVLVSGNRENYVQKLVLENSVIVFGKSGCCMCHVMKRLLLGLGVNPTVFEVDENEEAAVINELSNISCSKDVGEGEVQFPVVFVGGKLFGGLERVMATHISGELVPILKDAGALWL